MTEHKHKCKHEDCFFREQAGEQFKICKDCGKKIHEDENKNVLKEIV